MIDYSKASQARAAKASFEKAADTLIEEINKLREEYNEEWLKVEELRKGRNSIIENIIPVLKDNNIKLNRALNKCNNEEVLSELTKTTEELDYLPQEEVRVAMVRIDGRYSEIAKQGKKLDDLYEKLSHYYVPEQDYNDEVVISLNNIKSEDIKVEDNTLDQVVDVHPASEDILTSLDEYLDTKKETTDEELDLEDIEISTISEEDLDGKDNEGEGIKDFIINSIAPKEEVKEVESQSYELKSGQTLAQVVDYVYDGNLSWYEIYEYGENKDRIDKRVIETCHDLEEAIFNPDILTGITIDFPRQYITYEEISNESGYKKVA